MQKNRLHIIMRHLALRMNAHGCASHWLDDSNAGSALVCFPDHTAASSVLVAVVEVGADRGHSHRLLGAPEMCWCLAVVALADGTDVHLTHLNWGCGVVVDEMQMTP